MGCSGSKEDGGVKHPNSRGPRSPPSATEPTQADAMPKALLSAIASSKTDLHTLTTDTSSPSFYGYKGAGRSSASLGESVPPRSGRSEGFTDTSLYSTTSSKRSGGLAGYSGEKLSEQSDEEGIDDDFEDDDERGVAGSTARRGTVGGVVGTSGGLGAKRAGLPFLATGRSPGRRSSPGFGAQALPSRQDFSTSNEGEGITRKVSPPLPPSPSSVEDKTPAPSDLKAAEALAEPPSSTVRVLASSDGEGTLSARRGSVEAIVDAKSEGAAVPQSSPGTPRTEEASPTGRAPLASTVTPVRSAARGIGPLALFPEYPMFVLSLAGLGAARCIPDYRAALASGKLLPYDSLNRSTAFVVFVSHRWVNQSGGPLPGGSGGAQVSLRQQQQQQQDGGEGFGGGVNAPDLGTVKHEILMEGLNSILASLPREVAVFLWIDYSCIDQEDAESKWKGARSVAAYIQLSDAVFTPYAESFYSGSGEERSGGDDKRKSDARSGAAWWGAQSKSDYGASSSRGDRGRRRVPGRGAEEEEIGRAFANPLSEVCGSPWPSSYRSLQDLCSRAWCRLELLLCAALPLRDNGGFRYFVARGDVGRARDRPHFVYGDYQRRRKLAPEALARFADEAWAKSLDPLDGALSNPRDTEAIVHGMAPLRLASRFAAIASSNLSSSSSTPFSNAPTVTTAAAAAPANTTMTVAVASPTPSSVPHERKRHAVPSYVDAATGVPVNSGSNNSRGRLATDPGIDFSGVGGRARGRTSTATALELKEAVAVAAVAAAPSGGRVVGKSRVGGRGMIPPPIEARPMPNLADEAELSSWRRNDAPPDRLMSPAVKGSRIVASPMRPRTAGAESAVGDATSAARGASSMPGWLWDTVSQYPLAAGDSRTQYVDGSTYVGPLKDGKRHGNGAYFFQDGSQYEGAFKEDKRHGEGTLTLAGGGRYEGGWQNDLQHGQGTFYFADSSCFRGLWKEGKKKNGVFTYSSGGRYIGELHGGRRHGHGSFLYPDGSSYEGQWQDNVKHGEGTAWYASGNRYEGQWRNGKSHGEGTYYYATGARYEGQFDGGKCHGQGTYFYANGNRYVGEWKDDMKWGFGKAIYRNKAHYEGHFFMDKRHGYGRMWYSNAGTYEGEWASGKPHGHGTATHKDGEKYVGTYKAGLYHGEGCYWYTNGAVYEGEYRNGRVHGKGRATFPSGDSYAGEWKEGAMSGHGVYDFKAEGASYEGDFHNGRMHGVGVYRWPHGDVYRGSWEADRRCGRGRYEWTELGLTFEGTFRDDRRTGRGSIIFPDNSRYECQWEDDRAMDSTAEGTRSVHYRANGAECSGDCDVRCKDEGGDELRRLMRRINDQRMMQPVTPTIQAEEEQAPQQRPQQQQQQQQQQRERNTTAHKPSSSVEMAPSSKDQSSTERGIW